MVRNSISQTFVSKTDLQQASTTLKNCATHINRMARGQHFVSLPDPKDLQHAAPPCALVLDVPHPMKLPALRIGIALAAALLESTFASTRADTAIDPATLRAKALKVIAPIPVRPPGSENDTQQLVQLGHRLYFEKRLSKNGSQSCNSCHAVDHARAGVDNEPTSPGAFGKRGGRNSPTTWNAGFQFVQFWDGRAASLEAQAKGPILNPIEMAMPSEREVIDFLKSEPTYPRQFALAFKGEADPITYDNLAKAIAAYERTLVTHDRVDRFLHGEDRAINPIEQRGLDAFLTVGCTTCHNGPLLGGNSFQKVGLVKPYENKDDKGRSVVTKNEEDDYKFKVPTLRNIAATHPYFHDGGAKDLHDAVHKMAEIQLGLDLPADKEMEIVAFLHALTGREVKAAQAAN
jgi:cytochrome c peroxidase